MRLARPLRLLYVQVLLAMVLGMALGHFWPAAGALLKPLSDAFVGLVRMMIAPIVFCTIVSGITSLASGKTIGRTIMWEGACDRARLAQMLRAAEPGRPNVANDPATDTPG